MNNSIVEMLKSILLEANFNTDDGAADLGDRLLRIEAIAQQALAMIEGQDP